MARNPSPDPVPIPSISVGRYNPIARIGSGGMADVYLARAAGPAGFSKLAVIKRLRKDIVQDDEMIQMFLDEARLAARLNHPNVVNTFEVGIDEKGHFITMEFLDGQPLSRIIRHFEKSKRRFPLSLHLQVISDVLSALSYAHQLEDYDRSPLNIVHRDVSPQNIFVLYTGQAKLVDFGIAKAAGALTETRTGVLKGKLSYMPPEQARTTELDGRADLFAVGILLWEALVGRRLWEGKNEAAILGSLIAASPVPAPSTASADVPSPLEEVCMKALAIDRNDRYQTAADFQVALEEAIGRSDLRGSTRELGQVVEKEFGPVRTKLRDEIEAFIKRSDTEVTSGMTQLPSSGPGEISEPTLESAGAPEAQARASLIRVREARVTNPNVETLAAPPIVSVPKPRRRHREITGIFAVLALVGIGAAITIHRRAETMRSTPPLTSNEVAPQSQPELPPPTPIATASATPPVSGTVSIELAATPQIAKIFLDGVVVKNPYRTNEPRQSSQHVVKVSAKGFISKTVTIDTSSDVTVDLALSPVAVVAAPRRTSKPRTSETPPPQPSTASTGIASQPDQQSPPTMGESLTPPPRKPAVALDPANPWH